MSAVLEQTKIVRMGLVPYEESLEAMRQFNALRKQDTPDELWLLEHPPVYTLGLAADRSHAPRIPNAIPVVETERGGEITYHGPGQLVMYTLVDLARRGIKVKRFVWLLEQAVIELLGGRGERRPGAPGIYIEGAKIAALGIRVSRGCAFHGLSLNVDMDLAPFGAIDPCGYPGLPVTQLKAFGMKASVEEVGEKLADLFIRRLEHA
ncbi:MAG TPA: lipoyl(octanoyl) transferase LipB [Burkholderiales bacterium]|jgi:lipoyl(octanoyl) transferase|nr:lipoyl(octanoyl) transferase LipB [Burkholderiales bacterium]